MFMQPLSGLDRTPSMDQSHAHQGLSHHNRSQEQPHHLQDSYSSSWSGAVIHSPPEGETFNSVSASFVIPKPSIPAGSPNEKFYTVAAWVGIDGASASNVILQTGVDMTIAGGREYYEPWYETHIPSMRTSSYIQATSSRPPSAQPRARPASQSSKTCPRASSFPSILPLPLPWHSGTLNGSSRTT